MHLLLALLQVGAASAVRQPPEPLPPNLLVIVADDVGVDLVGSYAQSYPGLALEPCTPNLDQLAASGMRFTNVWSNPVCSPSRAQILTGRRSATTGVGTITLEGMAATNIGLQADETSIADLLPDYATAAVGKWHLSDPEQDGSTFAHPVQLGFDSYAGSLYGGPSRHYNDFTKTLTPPGVQVPGYSVYATTDTVADALALMGSLHEPWLIYVAFNSAHEPVHCPTDFGYDPADCQPGPCAQNWCLDCPTLVNDPLCTTWGVEACQTRAMVHSLDSKVGELLAAIDPARTAVLFTSDNGTAPGGIVPPFDPTHAKGNLYQGGIHVPLIVSAPGAQQGECHELVSLTDLFATLADLAGFVPPPDPLRDSVSLCQYLYPGSPGCNASPRIYVYSEYFTHNFAPVSGGGPAPGYEARFHHRAVRDARYKLIETYGWDMVLGACSTELHFFRLADAPPQDPAFGPDPFEQDDLMLSISSWTLEEQIAFGELVAQLTSSYPRLWTICD